MFVCVIFMLCYVNICVLDMMYKDCVYVGFVGVELRVFIKVW